MNADTCFALAHSALLQGNPQAACEFFEIALQQDANHVETLEAYGEVLLHHLNQPDRARQLLQHAARVCPNDGHVKYSNLAQLSEGMEALGYYGKALGIIRKELRKAKTDEEKEPLQRSVAEAKAAVAELYLTDLCDEPNAEERCEKALEEARAACDTCIDVYQTLGSLRITQECWPEAKAALAKAVVLYRSLEEGLLPAYENRVELGKLLMQVSPRRAFDWLRYVLTLDPENAYVWFLLGETARCRGRFHDSARLLKHARFSTTDAEELAEIDNAIQVLVGEMGGPEAVSQVQHMDEPNPLDFLAPEDDEDASEDDEEDDDDNSDEGDDDDDVAAAH